VYFLFQIEPPFFNPEVIVSSRLGQSGKKKKKANQLYIMDWANLEVKKKKDTILDWASLKVKGWGGGIPDYPKVKKKIIIPKYRS